MAVQEQNPNDLTLAGLRMSRPELSREDATLKAYLVENCEAFATVNELRERGWNSPEGDEVYRRKQERADNTIRQKDHERIYYEIYRKIAKELQEVTGAFTLPEGNEVRGLNLCMAPGGYTKALLENNPDIRISGITLPEEQGGHPVMTEVAKDPRVEIQYLDMNLLAPALGVPISKILASHPDAARFHPEIPFEGQMFDIVIADGAVLRTHLRENYRVEKEREALRLRLAQLSFGLERMKPGGTFIMLGHRIDSWENLALLRNFEHFSTVKVHKPKNYHTQSSSFYFVARNIQPSQVAEVVLKKWKNMWWQATFGGEDGKGETPEGPDPEELSRRLQVYGPRFIRFGSPVWKTQADALKRASYMKPREIKSFGADGSKTGPNFASIRGQPRWMTQDKQNSPVAASIKAAASWRVQNSGADIFHEDASVPSLEGA